MRFAYATFSDGRVGACKIPRVLSGSRGKQSSELLAHGLDYGPLG